MKPVIPGVTAKQANLLARHHPLRGGFAWEREARMWAGFVLFAFLLMHLLNHALGVFGLSTMQAVQVWRVWLWRTWPGTVLLYGAVVVHVTLALKRIAWRRTWHMPAEEAVQIVLGLAIPLLVLEHALGTRYASSMLGTDNSYPAILHILWPKKAYTQTALVLVAWTHGVIGIHYVFRHRPWFKRVREAGLVLAFTIPLLAIAGFISAGREASELDVAGAVWTREQIAAFTQIYQWGERAVLAVLLLLAAIVIAGAIARWLRPTVPIRYVGHGRIALRPGSTLLEASREHHIPHPSLCGGRGRCSTCRVLVLSGLETLPEPSATERALLTKISAPKSVRLACQIRPTQELTVQILLPMAPREGQLDWEEETYKWGVDRYVSILFVDIRAFTTLSKKQLPHDTVLLVNRFIGEITQTVEAHDGRVGMFLSDGLMAIFGLSGHKAKGSRSAIAAGLDMLKVASTLNTDLGSALPIPLRIGVGIHSGPAVIARVGDTERGYMVTALGETVSIASRLESATKELLADMIVSDVALQNSGISLPGAITREVQMAGRGEPIRVHTINDFAPVETAGSREKAGAP